MKSAGSSHSKAVMNSWSSIPNEYVVWLWIVGNSARRCGCARPSPAADRSAVARTTAGSSRTDRRRGRASRCGTTFRGRRAAVYCDAFVVARYEYGVSSQPASGVAFNAAPSSPRSSYRWVIFQRKKSESGRTPADRVGAQRIHPAGPLLDGLREGVLAGHSLLDRQPPPGGIDAEELVRDVLTRSAHAAVSPRDRLSPARASERSPGEDGIRRRTRVRRNRRGSRRGHVRWSSRVHPVDSVSRYEQRW